ncbi:hypothetical protein ACWF94_24805 [Streptomyces sp. NPDC055078]
MTDPGADERRIRGLLRRLGVGPDAPPPPAPTGPAGRTGFDWGSAPAAEPDWFDRLYADETTTDEPTKPARRPWYSLSRPAPAAAPEAGAPAPGRSELHVTIAPAPEPAISPRRARLRRWVLHRGTAAAVGWWLGIGPAAADAIADAGQGAVGVAFLLWAVAWYAATRLLLFVPRAATPEVHTAADWAAHIPSSTILLALALHTPGAIS